KNDKVETSSTLSKLISMSYKDPRTIVVPHLVTSSYWLEEPSLGSLSNEVAPSTKAVRFVACFEA
ncbi:hypothetical protein A2U01_0060086, partial [Trifolium medium]|nr:hypothetical protein [Trifolium medium]